MLSMQLRFEKWRGKKKATAEINFIDTAQQIKEYIDVTSDLAIIENDLLNPHSLKYKAFHSAPAMCALLYAKLSMDEAEEQLCYYDNSNEKLFFSEINNTLSLLYTDIMQGAAGYMYKQLTKKINTKENIKDLIKNVDQLLDLYPETVDKAHAKKNCLSLVFMLLIIQHALEDIPEHKKIALYTAGFKEEDIHEVRFSVSQLLDKVKVKVKLLESDAASDTPAEVTNSDKSIQGYLNARFLKAMQGDDADSNKVALLTSEINGVVVNLQELIANKKRKEMLEAKAQPLQTLLDVVIENDELISGRKYALQLIDENQASFDSLLDYSQGKNLALVNLVQRLRKPDPYDAAIASGLYAMSTASSFLTRAYRYLAPQFVQELVYSKMPATLDSDCKTQIKDLTKQCLQNVEEEVSTVNKAMHSNVQQLSNKQPDLMNLLANESTENLEKLVQLNHSIMASIDSYRKLLMSVQEKKLFLEEMQQYDGSLAEFIQINDGFLVKLSNFLAQFSRLFKSKAANMIDNALQIRVELNEMVNDYTSQIAAEQEVLEAIPLTKDMSVELTNALGTKTNVNKPSQDQMAAMIKQGTLLFKRKPSESKGFVEIESMPTMA